MHPVFRTAYNAAFTAELHERQRSMLVDRIGVAPAFPLAETPVFLTEELAESLEDLLLFSVRQGARN